MKLRADFFRYTGTTNKISYVKALISSPTVRFLVYFRMCQKFQKFHPLGFFSRIFFHFSSSKRHVEIPFTTYIGKGVYFGHFKNITINANAKIGNNCNIMQGVTIGNESRGKRKGTPKIGDRVVIGPNSVISGKISIGNDVLIGPLTFVNFDIPDKSVVIGNPAKIISDKGSMGYVKRVLQ